MQYGTRVHGLLVAIQFALRACRSLIMKVSFSCDALGAFLCHRGVSTPLSGFPTFETSVISLGFYLRPSKIPPRFGPTGQSQQDSNDYHRDNDDHDNHDR